MKEQLQFNGEASSAAGLLGISQERAVRLNGYIDHALNNEKFKTKMNCMKYLWAKAKKPEEAMFMAEVFGEWYVARSEEAMFMADVFGKLHVAKTGELQKRFRPYHSSPNKKITSLTGEAKQSEEEEKNERSN